MKKFVYAALRFLDPRTYFRRRDGVRTRSKLSTALSLLTHVGILGALWSIPMQELTKIEPPEIVVDAAVLPAPTEIEPQPVEPPPADVPPQSPSTEEVPAADAKSSGQTLAVDPVGVQNISTGNSGKTGGNGNSDGKDKVESQSEKKAEDKPKAPKVNPTPNPNPKPNTPPVPDVGKPQGFAVNFSGTIAQKAQKLTKQQERMGQGNSNNDNNYGKAELRIVMNGDGYESYLNASAKSLIASAEVTAKSTGKWRNGVFATERFQTQTVATAIKDRESSFSVDYPSKKATFINKGNTIVVPFEGDAIADFMSAIAYIQTGLANHKLQPGGSVSLLVGKRENIEKATIALSQLSAIDTPKGQVNAVMADVKINSGSLETIRIWYNQADNYKPAKMEIHVKEMGGLVITLLAN